MRFQLFQKPQRTNGIHQRIDKICIHDNYLIVFIILKKLLCENNIMIYYNLATIVTMDEPNMLHSIHPLKNDSERSNLCYPKI
jgi:hypothetical protein